jgi:hypothetical protein
LLETDDSAEEIYEDDSIEISEESQGASTGGTSEDFEDSENESGDSEEDSDSASGVPIGVHYSASDEDKEFYVDGMKNFLTKLSKNHQFFLYGRRTSQTESFHNVANIYYRKGSSSTSYEFYKMKKIFAALHWNSIKLLEGDNWKLLLLNRLIEFLKQEQEKRNGLKDGRKCRMNNNHNGKK